MDDTAYVVGVILAMGAVTFVLRALPFVASRWLQRHAVVARLGRFLPMAIMVLLLLHASVSMAQSHARGFWAEAVAVLLALALQWWGRNALASMAVATVVYVVMRNAA
ncbi:AzlD Predicted branched-chain amino acid permeases (azaleucine resistance) [Burkholderiaceae bacterium]